MGRVFCHVAVLSLIIIVIVKPSNRQNISTTLTLHFDGEHQRSEASDNEVLQRTISNVMKSCYLIIFQGCIVPQHPPGVEDTNDG